MNPYSAPEAEVADPPQAGSAAELVRQEFIRHEVLLKSIGSLYAMGAILFVMMTVAMFAMPTERGLGSGDDEFFMLGFVVVYGFIAVVMAVMAWGFRKLQPWVKYPGTALAVVGLLGIPVGTLVNAYVLYLIWCRAGRTVLEPGYAEIIAATPHVRYRRTLGDKIALGIVVVFLLGLVAIVLVGANT